MFLKSNYIKMTKINGNPKIMPKFWNKIHFLPTKKKDYIIIEIISSP